MGNIFVLLHFNGYLQLVLIILFCFVCSIQVLISGFINGFIVVMMVSSKMRKDLIPYAFHSECQ